MVDVDKLLELEARATAGKWESAYHNRTDTFAVTVEMGGYDACNDEENIIVCAMDGGSEHAFNTDLIAEMRNSIRELCLEVKALRAEVLAARECVEFLRKIDRRSGNYLDGEPPMLVLQAYDEARRG